MCPTQDLIYVTWNRNSMHCEAKYYIHYHDWLKARNPGLDSGQGKELFFFFLLCTEQLWGWSIKQTTHIYLIPRTGMVGVLLLSPTCLCDIVLSHSSTFINCIKLRSTTRTVLPIQGDNMVVKLRL
jgi:hypothetical protein